MFFSYLLLSQSPSFSLIPPLSPPFAGRSCTAICTAKRWPLLAKCDIGLSNERAILNSPGGRQVRAQTCDTSTAHCGRNHRRTPAFEYWRSQGTALVKPRHSESQESPGFHEARKEEKALKPPRRETHERRKRPRFSLFYSRRRECRDLRR